jgi:hypothetical protein
MIKRWMGIALMSCAALAQAQAPAPSPAKKELVQKLMQLQQSGLETVARNLVEQPAAVMMQEANRVLQTQVAAEKREAIGKNIQTSIKKYMDEAVPLVRDRAIKLAPGIVGTSLEEKFTEDELKQLIAWFESPVNKKFQQALPEIQGNFVQKLVADARPAMDPKLQALEQSIRTALANGAGAAPAAKPAAKPTTPKPSTSPASKP